MNNDLARNESDTNAIDYKQVENFAEKKQKCVDEWEFEVVHTHFKYATTTKHQQELEKKRA